MAGKARVRTFRFPGGREMVKAMSANWAIDMLRRYLLSQPLEVNLLHIYGSVARQK